MSRAGGGEKTGLSRQISLLAVAMVIMLLVLSASVMFSAELLRRDNQRAVHRQELLGLSEQLGNLLSQRVEALKVLAGQDRVLALLQGEIEPGDPEIGLLLDAARDLTGVEVVWILDLRGVAIANSRVQGVDFRGLDYSYRPYVQAALKGVSTVFPAFGANTNTRGAYLGTPVYGKRGQVIGAAAVKVSADESDALLRKRSAPTALVSPEGVIFSSNRPSQVFRSIRPLSPKTLARLSRTRQFGDAELRPLETDLSAEEENQPCLLEQASLPIPGWRVVSCMKFDPAFPLSRLQKAMLGCAVAVIGGLYTLALFLFVNIRLRKEYERALRKNSGIQNALLANIPAMVFLKGRDRRYISANRAFCEALGLEQGQVAGKTDAELMTAEEALAFSSGDAEVLAGAGPLPVVERRLFFGRPEARWFSLSKAAFRDENHEAAGIIGVALDVSARKQTEKRLAALNRELESMVEKRTKDLEEKANELRYANERLLELDEMKSSFLSSVSHEMRTPLTSIRGFAKLINRDFSKAFNDLPAMDPDLAKVSNRILYNLKIIEQEGDRLTRLINDVLDLNKIESGRIEWDDRPLSIKKVMDHAVRAVAGAFNNNPETGLEVRLDDDLPTIFADEDRLVQVMINLLDNAAKFTPAGKVQVTASCALPQTLHIKVSDTGIGIAKDDLAKVFNKFQQVKYDGSLLNKPKGTGLGLTICKEIVEHYKGRIWVESLPGKGSVFTVQLPTGHRSKDAGGAWA
ncbi:MAG: PAS domain-containing protein [Desulfovibrionaceae bacterium]|nr:PAS domain-containing protein [Desulfovibrionaceae bacterium]